MEDSERLEQMIQPLLEQRGMELVDLEVSRQKKRLLIRFFIDRIEGGVTIDELAEVNRELGAVLDLDAAIAESYILEVSSPGMNRRLRKLRDFQKYLNQVVQVEATEKLEGKWHFRGTLVGVDANGVTLVAEGNSYFIPHAKVKRANLEYRFE
jgi:ribosome maturation factor RimP